MKYQIGLFSKLGKTTVKTLRYYDEIGLLTPTLVDKWTSYRYYTTQDLLKLQEIMFLRQAGFSLDDIAKILGGTYDQNFLEDKINEQAKKVRDEKAKLSHLQNYIKMKKERVVMNYKPVVKEIPACTVFSYRTKLKSYDELNKIMPECGGKVAKLNPDVKCAEPEYCCIIYHDGEYKESDIDVEICQAVDRKGLNAEGIEFKELPETRVISVLHKGAYSQLGLAYDFLFKWVEENGYKIADNPRESYIDGVWNKDSEEDYLTELQIPVKK